MNILKAAGLVIVGGIAGATMTIGLHAYIHSSVVHAQDQFTTFAGCVSAVPKAWGNFMGGSEYGLAFEDDNGTVRFLQHPLCGSALSVNNAPTPTMDMEIVRK